ncbi:uncharacterized protein LOC114871161 isoform X2 [Osmia bicornis bicornis]|uniref:uncharacterized protein LOC114871161 isoform X2 n=1 Tax=Osmia bicornis bicornis TaxID=1437191 RepID=UPI001EAE8501|nr:uncharacterized protein LOC114871161 isoform X2 [Osmia bicornis bicornis]
MLPLCAGTENLTCRFIQLRKENGKLFTGRKYSAQAGWEYILQQMRQEFPSVMANVHYRVLKKKWSNLLQQYKHVGKFSRGWITIKGLREDKKKNIGNPKDRMLAGRQLELRNPVHGDRNKADDVSWPFYSAIDQVLGHDRATSPINDEYIDPHEFLCVSVTPEEPTSSVDTLPAGSNPEIVRRAGDSSAEPRLQTFGDDCSIEIKRIPANEPTRQTGKYYGRRKRDSKNSMPRLPRATVLTIKKVTSEADCSSKDSSRVRGNDLVDSIGDKERAVTARNEDEERPRKSRRSRIPYREDHESRTDRRIEQIFEYIKRRDEENRSIMIRVMHAVETIANKL